MKKSSIKRILALLTAVAMLAAMFIQCPVKSEAKSVKDYKKVWSNTNNAKVSNKPTKATTFKVASGKKLKLKAISVYHYNGGKGKKPGTITLKKGNNVIGKWNAKGRSNNKWWDVFPNKTLSSGTYTIISSSKNTWSRNNKSKGAGFAQVYGTYSNLVGIPAIKSIAYDHSDGYYIVYKVTWKSVSKASGYQFQQSKTKDFKNPVLDGTVTNPYVYPYQSTGYGNNIKYYVRVRSYKMSGSKKVYGPWSSVKTYVFKW